MSPEEKQNRITHYSWAALGANVIYQPGSWQFFLVMNVQYPPLSWTQEGGGNRPTLNTWDSRDVLSALHKTLYMPVSPWPTTLHIKVGTYSISQRLNKRLLFMSVLTSATPTRQPNCIAAEQLQCNQGNHVVSFNCKPFVSSHRGFVYNVHLWYIQDNTLQMKRAASCAV